MAFTVGVGPVSNSTTGSTSIAVTLNGCTAGRHLLIGVQWYDPDETDDDTINSITINGETNATLIGTPRFVQVIHYGVQLAYLANITGGGNKTVTVTGTAHSSDDFTIFVLEFAGGDVASFLDASAGDVNNGSNPSYTLTTGTNGALIVSLVTNNAAEPTPGGAYTNIDIADAALFTEGEYDLDAGAAGGKTIDYANCTGFWSSVAASFKPVTGPGGAPSFSRMTASGGPGARGALSFESMIAENNWGAVSFSQMTAAGTPAASGQVSFSQMTALSGRPVGAVSFENLTVFGEAREGGRGAGAAFEIATATGDAKPVNVSNGAASFAQMTAVGWTPRAGAVAFEKLEASGIGRGANNGAASFEPMYVPGRSGAARFESLQAYGVASENLLETYDTKVMNTRLSAMTEFTNYKFNSFARIGKDYYGVGPNGLLRLDGVTDNGTDINWSLRTGRHDDKKIVIKRIPEVVLGLRSNGFITVRVWSDDNTFHDYALPKVDTTTLHQHRVVPGKGLQSKYFGIELRGTKNATLELDSMQVDMKTLGTRLG